MKIQNMIGAVRRTTSPSAAVNMLQAGDDFQADVYPLVPEERGQPVIRDRELKTSCLPERRLRHGLGTRRE